MSTLRRLLQNENAGKNRQVNLALPPTMALTMLLTGDEPNETHWDILAGAINLALLNEAVVESGHIAEIKRAIEHLDTCHKRGRETRKWRLNGEWVNDIKTALRVYTEQTESLTRNELEDALRELVRILDLSAAATSGEPVAVMQHSRYKVSAIQYFDNFDAMLLYFGITDFEWDGEYDTFGDASKRLINAILTKLGKKCSLYVVSKQSAAIKQWYCADNIGIFKSMRSRGWL